MEMEDEENKNENANNIKEVSKNLPPANYNPFASVLAFLNGETDK